MKRVPFFVLVLLSVAPALLAAAERTPLAEYRGSLVGELARPRVIITTDFPPLDVIPSGAGSGPADKRSDPDDVQSMVRFLL